VAVVIKIAAQAQNLPVVRRGNSHGKGHGTRQQMKRNPTQAKLR